MVRVVPLAIAAMVLCAMLVVTTSTADMTYLISKITSFFTSASGFSRGFCRRILTSFNINHALTALTVRARDSAAKELYIFKYAAKKLFVPYISVCRHIVTDAIEEYPLLRLAEEYLLPQPSYENLTFHAERGACVWTMSSTGLPADFSPHTGTLFLLLATNICTAIFCLAIGAAILAPLRIVWRIMKALASFAAEPEATLETVLDGLIPVLARLFAVGVNVLVFCGTGLVFCSLHIATYVASLDIGFFTKRRAPQVEPPKVFYRTLIDPRVPELEKNVCRLETEMEEKSKNSHTKFREDAARISGLMDENEELKNANLAQKKVIRSHWSKDASIGLTRPLRDQFLEKQKQCNDLQSENERIVKENKETEKKCWARLGEKTDEIRSLKRTERGHQEEYAALLRSQEFHQDRARKDDEASRLTIEFQKGRIQELETLMSSGKETLNARIKELLAIIESLEAQLKERDEVINTQKESIQALETRNKEQEARHLSVQKSQKAQLMKGFERERNKLTNLSRLSSEARKAAEEKLKTAEEALKAAEKARKAAEENSAADLKALTTAEKALKAAEEARKAAENESASLRERLDNRAPSHDKGTQASSPPPSPRKTPGSPSTTPPGSPPGSPRKTPPPSPQKTPGSPSQTPLPPSPTEEVPPPSAKGLGSCPPVGQRPMAKPRSVARKPKSKLSSGNSGFPEGMSFPNMSSFSFNFLSGTTPNIPGTNPGAPTRGPTTPPAAPSNPEPKTPPAEPSAPAPSTPEPKSPEAAPSNPEPANSPAGPSTPKPETTEDPTTPEAAPSNPEPANPSTGPSTPEPKTPAAAPSTPEPAPAESSPGKPSGGSGESEQPEPVNPAPAEGTSAEGTPAEGSPAKAASPSGEPPAAPEPASA